nr:hypothetical protein BaRGS_033854 [Batillaria attramentaria]
MSRVDMAADDKKPSPTPQGKVKKKSALAKLVERKKRQTSDGDSENAATAKGEKRNHEPGNSSSEEVDMKRQAHAGLASPKSNRAYKADPSYRAGSSSMLKKMSKALSDGGLGNGGASSAQLGSDNISFTSTSVMPVITTREARSRSFLVGSVSSGASSILGPEELERYFPDRRIHIFSGSWNMNELKELSVNLNDFILPEACEYVQDIYAVGTQENEMNK